MLRILCPFCGLRDHAEFSYGGDASPPPPPFADGDINRWHDYIYLRENPKGRHREFWRHSHGCRQWLVVERDTATHEIFSVSSADEKSNE